MSHDEVKKMFHNIKLPMYNLLISQLSRLAEEPYAYKYKNLIMKYRVVFQVQIAAKLDQLETKVDENGREYSEAQGKRKTAVADVRVYSKGKGRITINGEEFDEFFPLITDRQVVITPFNLLRMNLFFDVEANVRGGLSGIWMSEKGSSPQFPTNPKTSQAGAIRLGIARALQPFVGATTAEILRRAGLLTQDPRKKERKKPGQWKARKKFTWKKKIGRASCSRKG
uniref:28S ribosomal protein S9, mitochondrial n=1 Tax=Phallusia mammillata TaxID=59560 RepID=A0A6F9DM67_9ASCI|nr:28S ribosomal protein S9, mitochondrial [Phallusia mammillata]